MIKDWIKKHSLISGIACGVILALYARLYAMELDFHLNHREIENNSKNKTQFSEKDLKAQRERDYLNSSQYRDYREWCSKNGLGYSQREIDRDRENGGTLDNSGN